MESKDLTEELSDGDGDKGTQPTLTSLLQLVREVKRAVEANTNRLDRVEATVISRVDALDTRVGGLSTRLDESVSRLTRDIEGVNARIIELSADMNNRFSEIGYKIDALNRGRLQTEADYHSLFHRITNLESRAS